MWRVTASSLIGRTIWMMERLSTDNSRRCSSGEFFADLRPLAASKFQTCRAVRNLPRDDTILRCSGSSIFHRFPKLSHYPPGTLPWVDFWGFSGNGGMMPPASSFQGLLCSTSSLPSSLLLQLIPRCTLPSLATWPIGVPGLAPLLQLPETVPPEPFPSTLDPSFTTLPFR